MSPAPRTPFDGTDRLVVDGTNLLYRLGQGRAAPPAAIVGRLRAAVPATIAIDLVFDGVGHGVSGRVAQQMFVRYSGRRSGDELILDLAAGAVTLAGGDAAAAARVLAVTDDRDLRAHLMARGVRTVPLHWIMGRLDLPILASPAAGNRRPMIASGREAARAGASPTGVSTAGANALARDEDRPGWKPGRGATSKTGPAHKVPRHRRHPKHP